MIATFFICLITIAVTSIVANASRLKFGVISHKRSKGLSRFVQEPAEAPCAPIGVASRKDCRFDVVARVPVTIDHPRKQRRHSDNEERKKDWPGGPASPGIYREAKTSARLFR